MKLATRLLLPALILSLSSICSAASLTLKFELPPGTITGTSLANYYSSEGVTISSGGVYTCLDGPGAVASCFSSRGGLGDPASQTGAMVTLANQVIVDYDKPFESSVTLFYVLLANQGPASLAVYSGTGGTGTPLGILSLPANLSNLNSCPGYPGGFCPFSQTELAFSGQARSLVLTGPPQYIVYDDISVTFPEAGPEPSEIPEPSTCWTVLGLAVFAIARGRQTATTSAP